MIIENGGKMNNRKIFDISMTIHNEMPVYKGRSDKKPNLYKVAEYSEKGINETEIKMNLHTGTHIDAPYHINFVGETIENIDLSRLICSCRVIDLLNVDENIKREDLEKENIKKGESILLKTKNSIRGKGREDFVYLDYSAGEFLAGKEISLIGFDELGIERNQPGHPVHKKLLGSGVIIIEGLELENISPGEYEMVALPLKIKGVDGAPARVILLGGEE